MLKGYLKRLGIASNKDDVLKVEKKLMKYFPKEEWGKRHLQMVLFGRYYCKAIKPDCDNCKLKDICYEKKRKILIVLLFYGVTYMLYCQMFFVFDSVHSWFLVVVLQWCFSWILGVSGFLLGSLNACCSITLNIII